MTGITETATWNNWKGHGRPQSFTYLGQDRKGGPAEISREVASVETGNSSWYTYNDADGKQIFSGGVATKFWASPAPAVTVVTNDKGTDILVVDPAKVGEFIEAVTSTATRPAKPSKIAGLDADEVRFTLGGKCCCQCGGATSSKRRLFIQGHDAKLLSTLMREVLSNRIDPSGALELCPTRTLQAKLTERMAKRVSYVPEPPARPARAEPGQLVAKEAKGMVDWVSTDRRCPDGTGTGGQQERASCPPAGA
jgi:hypothetical protein